MKPQANSHTNRWLIALMGVITHLCLGTVYAWSFFQKPITETFHWSNSQTMWAFSIAIAFLGFSAAWAGLNISRYGVKKLAVTGGLLYASSYFVASYALQSENLILLYIGFGVLGGTGLGLAYVTPVATVSRWFPDKLGLATGLVVMGFGLGALVMSKVLAPLYLNLSNNSLSTAFLYIGFTLLIVLPLVASFLKMPPSEVSNPSQPLQVSEIRTALQSQTFVVIWFVFSFNIIAGMLFISFQSPLLQDLIKLHDPQATTTYLQASGATLIAVSSLFNGIGRFFWGSFSDKWGRVYTFRILLITQAIAFVILIYTQNVWVFSILVSYILLCYGGGFGVMPSFVKDNFGNRLMPLVYGAMLTAWSVGGIIGPQIAALMKDRFGLQAGSYSFVMALVLLLLGIVLSFNIKNNISKK